jgi:hypothetical protein
MAYSALSLPANITTKYLATDYNLWTGHHGFFENDVGVVRG